MVASSALLGYSGLFLLLRGGIRCVPVELVSESIRRGSCLHKKVEEQGKKFLDPLTVTEVRRALVSPKFRLPNSRHPTWHLSFPAGIQQNPEVLL